MNKLRKINNLKFNKHLVRLERWHRITAMLSDYEGVVRSSYEHVSPEEVIALREIQTKLSECMRLSCVMLGKEKNSILSIKPSHEETQCIRKITGKVLMCSDIQEGMSRRQKKNVRFSR